MIQRTMLNMIKDLSRKKIKRLIKRGIRKDNILFDRVMESVNKPQVQAMISASGLEPMVVEGYVREMIVEELSKPQNKHWWSVIFGQSKQTA